MSELRAGAPIAVAGITLIPIERVRITCEKQVRAYWLNATKEALAIVVCDPAGPRVVDVEAHELPVEGLLAQVPGLELLLAEVASS
jgi:hypothetical protein